MGTVKLAYVDAFKVGGVWRYYFRRSRKHKRIPLPGRPGDAEFMRAYETALAASGAKGPSRHLTVAGSFSALALAYYRSGSFQGLKASTQGTYRGIIDRFCATVGKNGNTFGQNRVATIKTSHVHEIIDGAIIKSGPAAANNLLKVLRVILDFAVKHDWRTDNPAIGVDWIENKTDGFATWSDDERRQFEEVHPSGSKARLAYSLLFYTAQRRGDVVKLGRQHVTNETLRFTQSKTGVPLAIPIHPKLKIELEASKCSNNLTFLLTKWDRPFSVAGFGNWFRDVCNQAGLPHLSAHGLRKAAAKRLAEAGCSAHEIQAITGHKTLAQVSRYTAAASQEKMARRAIGHLDDN